MFKILFDDKEKGDILTLDAFDDSMWDQIPDTPIIKIEYESSGRTVVLEGFEAYGHFQVGGTKDDFRPILRTVIMGKWKERVYQTVFDFEKSKVYTQLASGEISYDNWKDGLHDLDLIPKMRLKEESGDE